jgi:hypothetical protein
MRPGTANNGRAYCDHTPTTVVVMTTASGYRVRCLKCGQIGPETENPGKAWVALKQRPSRERLGRLRRT